MGVNRNYFYTLKKTRKAMSETLLDSFNSLLLEAGINPCIKEYREKPYSPSLAVNQRSGDAHMCINGMLLCGEQDLTVRYYRAHEEWLNQAKICPDCLKAFKEAEKIWKDNQEPSKVQPKEQPREEKGLHFTPHKQPDPVKVTLITPYGTLDIPQGTKFHIEHQIGEDIHIDIWTEEDNR